MSCETKVTSALPESMKKTLLRRVGDWLEFSTELSPISNTCWQAHIFPDTNSKDVTPFYNHVLLRIWLRV